MYTDINNDLITPETVCLCLVATKVAAILMTTLFIVVCVCVEYGVMLFMEWLTRFRI